MGRHEIAEEESVSPLRGSSFFRIADPVLTLRLRSGQAHWANFCRASGAGAESNVSTNSRLRNETWLHGDGIFCVARDVPAGIVLCVGKDCAGAGKVFFGGHRVDLIFGFVALVGNRKKADAVDGRVGRTQARSREPHVVPGEIKRVSDEKQQDKRRGDAENQAHAGGRAIIRDRHSKGLRRYSASRRALEEARIEEVDRVN